MGIEVLVPGRGLLRYETAVFDFNGTLADGGHVCAGVPERLRALAGRLKVYVLTADTFGSVRAAMAGQPVEVVVLDGEPGGPRKEAFVRGLGAETCAAFGNGSNDAAMLRAAGLGVLVLGPEGAAGESLAAADVVVRDINDGIDLLLDPRRLTATLRL